MSAANPLVPELRFPEFKIHGDWKTKQLDELGKFTGGGTPSKANDSFWKGSNPWVSSSDIDEESIHELNISRFISDEAIAQSTTARVPPNSILLVSRVGVGKLAITQESIFTSQDFTNFTPAKADLHFLAYYLKQKRTALLSLNQGMAIRGFTKKEISKFNVSIPELPEQQKIADCLGSLDELLAAHRAKLDALQDHKKGLLQQLFPAEGETTPKLRFPRFEGEWEQKKMGSLATNHNKQRKPISSNNRLKGPYPYYGASGIVDYISEYIFTEPRLLVGEDGAKWSAFEQTAFIVEGKYWVNNHAHVFSSKTADIRFLESYLIALDISQFVTGAAPPKLTLENVKKIPIPIPPKVSEQQKIADCLSALDALITAETEQIVALKAHKKGLMQKLFPKPELSKA